MHTTQRELEIGGRYRHFKGTTYKVLLIANDCETDHGDEPRKLVVYQAEYGDKPIWVRDYDMFMSEVDKEKYPDITQQYRFELID